MCFQTIMTYELKMTLLLLYEHDDDLDLVVIDDEVEVEGLKYYNELQEWLLHDDEVDEVDDEIHEHQIDVSDELEVDYHELIELIVVIDTDELLDDENDELKVLHEHDEQILHIEMFENLEYDHNDDIIHIHICIDDELNEWGDLIEIDEDEDDDEVIFDDDEVLHDNGMVEVDLVEVVQVI